MPSASDRYHIYVCLFSVRGAANDLVVKRQAESEAKIEFLIQTSKKRNSVTMSFRLQQVLDERLSRCQ